jgi:hypothetical protein
MSIHSKNKGKRGEREAAKELRLRLDKDDIIRGQQNKGGIESPDVMIADSSLHPEIKRVERLNIYDAVDQAVRDGQSKVPFVMHRRNNREWLITIRLSDLIAFCREILRLKDA